MADGGQALIQILVGNAADFAASVGAKRLTLETCDDGGYLWARAGAVPVGSWLIMRDAVSSRTSALERRGQLTAQTAGRVRDLVPAGEEETSLVRPLSGPRCLVLAFAGAD